MHPKHDRNNGTVLFADAPNLKTANLKDCGTVAGFASTGLETLNLENVEVIGRSAFYDTRSLKTVNLKNVQEIGDYAFMNYNNTSQLENLDLTGVKIIGQSAFYGASKLTNLVVPDTVESIGSMAFYQVNPADLTISSDKIEMYINAKGGFSKIQNIYCTDGADACKAVLTRLNKASLLGYVKDAPVPSEERQLADGSVALYRDGKLVGFRGKRIYTVEEAALISKDTGNTIKLRYK